MYTCALRVLLSSNKSALDVKCNVYFSNRIYALLWILLQLKANCFQSRGFPRAWTM